MELNPYPFNRDAQYPARPGFPRNLTACDVQEAHIQVVVPEKSGGRGDFTILLQDVFDKYKLPHISSNKVLKSLMQFEALTNRPQIST